MNDEQHPYHFQPGDEPPIPIPPVENAWSQMRQQLDAKMPMARHWYSRYPGKTFWQGGRTLWIGAGALTACLSTLLAIRIIVHKPTAPATAARASTLAPVPGHPASIPVFTPAPSPSTESAAPALASAIAHGSASASIRPSHASTGSSQAYASSTHLPASQEAYIHASNVQAMTAGSRRHTTYPNNIHSISDRDRTLASHGRTMPDEDQTVVTTGHSIPGHSLSAAMPARTSARPLSLAVTRPALRGAFFATTDSLLRAAGKKPAYTASQNRLKGGKHHPSGILLTAGLSIAKSFPLGQQQSIPYNVNGTSNRISDYIPAPFFRLSVGNRFYLETALQINTPQYIHSQGIDTTGGDTSHIPGWQNHLQYNYITLKKLYYTDIPLSIHYRLFDQFFLGAGLQYSRLWGAVGQEDIILRPTNGIGSDTLYSSQMMGLKKNASKAYNKLARADWRLLLEADYHWRRLTLSARYEQGLSNYLLTLPGGTPGSSKNSSISLRLFYDLWNPGR
jgi:hypothetical protein